MKKVKLIIAGLISLIFIGLMFGEDTAEADIEVSTRVREIPGLEGIDVGQYRYQTMLVIQMIEDNVEIKDVSVNRGRCQFSPKFSQRGKTSFSFGDTFEGSISSGCSIKEVTITTGRGTFSFEF